MLISRWEILQPFCDALVAQRKALGMSQTELAEKIGVSRSTIARLESQVTIPTADVLFRACEAVDLHFSLKRGINK